MTKTAILVSVILLLAILPALAQQDAAGVLSVADTAPHSEQFLMTLAFCVVGLLAIFFQFILFYRRRESVAFGDFITGVGTQTIIIAVIVLAGIGYSSAQVQPAFTLLGTALGYLLGKTKGSTQTIPDKSENPPPNLPAALILAAILTGTPAGSWAQAQGDLTMESMGKELPAFCGPGCVQIRIKNITNAEHPLDVRLRGGNWYHFTFAKCTSNSFIWHSADGNTGNGQFEVKLSDTGGESSIVSPGTDYWIMGTGTAAKLIQAAGFPPTCH